MPVMLPPGTGTTVALPTPTAAPAPQPAPPPAPFRQVQGPDVAIMPHQQTKEASPQPPVAK